MPIPDFQTLMLPLLELASDGKSHNRKEAAEKLAQQFNLTEDERTLLLPSGRDVLFSNRIGWAMMHLRKAKLLDTPKRGLFTISRQGTDVLERKPLRIDMKFLEQFPEYMEFRDNNKDEQNSTPSTPQQLNIEQTPEEQLDQAYQILRKELAQEVLTRVLSCSPTFFEHLVVELLVRMGYGGSMRDAGERIGKSGDGGIDGIIKEDRLGLDAIYIQAKRWQDSSVGRPEIQKFVGALQGQRANKGVFITTSSFTADAKDYVAHLNTKVVLIDGKTLANMMIDFDVGVSVATTYALKRIDSDYFDEDI